MKAGCIGVGIMVKSMSSIFKMELKPISYSIKQEVVRKLAEIIQTCNLLKTFYSHDGIAEHRTPHTVIININSVAIKEAEVLVSRLKGFKCFY